MDNYDANYLACQERIVENCRKNLQGWLHCAKAGRSGRLYRKALKRAYRAKILHEKRLVALKESQNGREK